MMKEMGALEGMSGLEMKGGIFGSRGCGHLWDGQGKRSRITKKGGKAKWSSPGNPQPAPLHVNIAELILYSWQQISELILIYFRILQTN